MPTAQNRLGRVLTSENREWKGSYLPFVAGKQETKTFNSTRLAGVEWEYNFTYMPPIREWGMKWGGGNHYDGSCGFEAVTPPLSGDYIEKCLTDLGKAFSQKDTVNSSPMNFMADRRCSVHVHVDARDYTWPDMTRLLNIYNRLEPLLYILAGYQRASSTYCKPCGKAYDKAICSSSAYKETKKTEIMGVAFNTKHSSVENHARRAGKKDGGRYRGLNIIPWIVGKRDFRSDCTVEFRMHENANDHNRVIEWTKLLVRIVDWCKTARKTKLPKNTLKLLLRIAPESEEWIMGRLSTWKNQSKKIHFDPKEGIATFVEKPDLCYAGCACSSCF